MSTTTTSVVEFVEGPLDGHQQIVSLTPDELDDVVILPLGRVLALLYGDRAYEALKQFAVYELVSSRIPRPSYRYVGAVSAPVC